MTQLAKEAEIVESFGYDIIASTSLLSDYDIKAVAYSCAEVGRWLGLLLDDSPLNEYVVMQRFHFVKQEVTIWHPNNDIMYVGDANILISLDLREVFIVDPETRTVKKPVVNTVSDLAKVILWPKY